MNAKFQYHFNIAPPQRNDTAQRAALMAFQTYPANLVQGAGTFVSGRGVGGSYWRATQAPQVFQQLRPVVADLYGGGAQTGTIVHQGLVDTSGSMG